MPMRLRSSNVAINRRLICVVVTFEQPTSFSIVILSVKTQLVRLQTTEMTWNMRSHSYDKSSRVPGFSIPSPDGFTVMAMSG